MSRDHGYTDEELALLTPAEREGLVGEEPQTERQRHLAWCKKRALEYADRGDLREAVASMVSDMRKHSETSAAVSGGFGLIGLMYAASDDAWTVERWIEGFN